MAFINGTRVLAQVAREFAARPAAKAFGAGISATAAYAMFKTNSAQLEGSKNFFSSRNVLFAQENESTVVEQAAAEAPVASTTIVEQAVESVAEVKAPAVEAEEAPVVEKAKVDAKEAKLKKGHAASKKTADTYTAAIANAQSPKEVIALLNEGTRNTASAVADKEGTNVARVKYQFSNNALPSDFETLSKEEANGVLKEKVSYLTAVGNMLAGFGSLIGIRNRIDLAVRKDSNGKLKNQNMFFRAFNMLKDSSVIGISKKNEVSVLPNIAPRTMEKAMKRVLATQNKPWHNALQGLVDTTLANPRVGTAMYKICSQLRGDKHGKFENLGVVARETGKLNLRAAEKLESFIVTEEVLVKE